LLVFDKFDVIFLLSPSCVCMSMELEIF